MAEPIIIDTDVLPVPKQSTRIGRMPGIWGRVQAYGNPRVISNAKTLAVAFWPHRPEKPWTGAIKLDVHIAFQNTDPATWGTLCTEKGDWDNLGKQVGDVLARCRFFENDRQIACGSVTKYWNSRDRLFVQLTEVDRLLPCEIPQKTWFQNKTFEPTGAL